MPKKRCDFEGCKKKISFVEQQIVCRCGKCFCSLHKIPEAHNCTFEFKKIENIDEKINSMKCVASKIEVI